MTNNFFYMFIILNYIIVSALMFGVISVIYLQLKTIKLI